MASFGTNFVVKTSNLTFADWSSPKKTFFMKFSIDDDGNVSCPSCYRPNVFLDYKEIPCPQIFCHMCKRYWPTPRNMIYMGREIKLEGPGDSITLNFTLKFS